MKKISILTGAGISVESGIQIFRGSNGLWEGYNITDVASPEGFIKNPELVLDFYNQRRRQLLKVKPNRAHKELAKFEKQFQVQIITQNVDDLHERAGSKNVLHLHGELLKVRSTLDKNLIYPWYKDLKIGDLCEKKTQLRPHIVWFGEQVPMINKAIDLVANSDIFIIIGTSLQVYPASGLIEYLQPKTPIFLIDPKPRITEKQFTNLTVIKENASKGVQILTKLLSEL